MFSIHFKSDKYNNENHYRNKLEIRDKVIKVPTFIFEILNQKSVTMDCFAQKYLLFIILLFVFDVNSVIVFERLVYNSNYPFANASVTSFKNENGAASFSASWVYVHDVIQLKVFMMLFLIIIHN